MSIDGIQQNAFQAGLSQAGAAAAGEAAKGVFMGHAVAAVESPESLLADAAEELTFSVDTTDKFSINERKERESSRIGRKLLELYRVLMARTGKSDKTQEAIARLKNAADRQAMRNAVLSRFSDVTDAWAAFAEALETFEHDPSVSQEQLRDLQTVADEFERENSTAIRLGLQGALAAEGYPELGELDETRNLYRHTVGEFSNVTEVFAEIQAKYDTHFDKAMDFLFSAISADIDSESPSMGSAHLESIHHKLGLVRLTQSAYRICEDVMNRWQNVHGEKGDLNAMGLLGAVMDLQSKGYVSATQVNDICLKARPSDIEHEVLFLQDLLSAVRKFPVELFETDQGRMSVLDAVQGAVDDAVNREDEYLASLE